MKLNFKNLNLFKNKHFFSSKLVSISSFMYQRPRQIKNAQFRNLYQWKSSFQM